MTALTPGSRQALIIGAGIGGLAAGIALRQRGWNVSVFERAPELREVGAGLAIWANAMRALDRLGVAEHIRAAQPPLPSAGLYTWYGQPLIRSSQHDLQQRVGEISVMLHRAELVELLYRQLGSAHVHLNRQCVRISQTDRRVSAYFADGSQASGDLLIGADGINSLVRAHCIGDGAPLYAGYTAYRGVVSFRAAHVMPGEYWGAGLRFGLLPLSGGHYYWFATRNAPAQTRQSPEATQKLLSSLFRHWASPIPALIAATEPQAILQNDIADRPPLRRWSKGRMSLLGDAAHPTTPNIGQGACQALEDAVVLADALASQPDIPAALRQYERRRIPRTSQIVRQSRLLGQIGQWSHPLACRLRELLLRLLVAPRQDAALAGIIGYRI